IASAACLTALSRLIRCMSTHEESSSAEVNWSDSRSCIISVPSHLIGKSVAERYAPIWGYSDSGTDDRFLPSVSAGVLPVPDRPQKAMVCPTLQLVHVFQVGVAVQALFVEAQQRAALFIGQAAFPQRSLHVAAQLHHQRVGRELHVVEHFADGIA